MPEICKCNNDIKFSIRATVLLDNSRRRTSHQCVKPLNERKVGTEILMRFEVPMA